MKKFFIILATVLLIAGLGIFTIAFAAAGFKIGNLGKEVEEHLKSIVAGNVPFGWKVDDSRKR